MDMNQTTVSRDVDSIPFNELRVGGMASENQNLQHLLQSIIESALQLDISGKQAMINLKLISYRGGQLWIDR